LWDNVAAIGHFAQGGLIDPKRVGMIGGSYGGYMSALAATKASEHFAAAINFAGSCSHITCRFGWPSAYSRRAFSSLKLLSWQTTIAPRAANSAAAGGPAKCSTFVMRTTRSFIVTSLGIYLNAQTSTDQLGEKADHVNKTGH
ncbi:MAG TPA: hypothetical protein EYQ81_02000, partial [Sneathiellales bacterium]|nr:hypothetical protein [Sneathiellales bacterium]